MVSQVGIDKETRALIEDVAGVPSWINLLPPDGDEMAALHNLGNRYDRSAASMIPGGLGDLVHTRAGIELTQWRKPLPNSFSGAYLRWSLNIGLPISSRMQSTGFRRHSSICSVFIFPSSSITFPTTSHSSHNHSGPVGSLSSFWR